MSQIRPARTLFFGILVALLTTAGATEQLTAQAPVATLTGPAVLDDWGNRFTSLGASVPENALRTQIRTTIAQLAMFDAVNAVLDGPYRPFASKPAVASRRITGSRGDPRSVHRRPERVPDEDRDDRERLRHVDRRRSREP